MDIKNKIKKPFGLTLACNIATEALGKNIAPASVIVGNLFFLQTSNHFPKDLDVNFFSTAKRALTDNEKRLMVQLLPDLKKPAFQIPEVLENAIKENWVKKVPLPQTFNKPFPVKKNFVKKPTVKSPALAPVVIVKKNKLT